MGTGKTIVHIKVGGDIGDGQPVFIPDQTVIDDFADQWQEALGDDYIVIATHHLVEAIIYDEPVKPWL
jgi:hypothetical protein